MSAGTLVLDSCRPTGRWTERWCHALGATAQVQVLGGPPGIGDHVVGELERLEQCWSRFRPASELSRLNADPGALVAVTPTLGAALSRARLAWELTDGWFDPTVLDSLEAAGYSASFPIRPALRGDLAQCRGAVGMADVTIDLGNGTVERPPGVRFDLGGLGKGLAADLVAVGLVESGADGACVGLGGDVRVAGAGPDGGWVVPVERPAGAPADRVASPWFEARLSDGAIVTSTTRFRAWTTTAGERAHHLIDPRTGRPATSDVDSVIVAAGEAWWAEVLAKSALVAGLDDGRRLLERHGVTGWLVPSEEPAP